MTWHAAILLLTDCRLCDSDVAARLTQARLRNDREALRHELTTAISESLDQVEDGGEALLAAIDESQSEVLDDMVARARAHFAPPHRPS